MFSVLTGNMMSWMIEGKVVVIRGLEDREAENGWFTKDDGWIGVCS